MYKRLTSLFFLILLPLALLAGPVSATDTSLVAHYEFEGNANDSSGNGHNGTEEGDPNYQAGKIDQAIYLDGDDDYVDLGNNSAFSITGNITVTAWIQFSPSSGWKGIVTKGEGSWRLQLIDNKGYFACQELTPNMDVWGTKNISGGWHHIAGVYDGFKLSLYVDGVLDTSESALGSVGTNSEPVYIGANSEDPPSMYKGLIDDVRIYDRALSEAEVAHLAGTDYPTASNPRPVDTTKYVLPNTVLSWTAGDYAADTNGHDVYFGTDKTSVEDANRTYDEYMGCFDVNTYDTNNYDANGLQLGQTYYWRVDEVNNACAPYLWPGPVWSFTVLDTAIGRVKLMPNMPGPYSLRDWKQVATDYDQLVFNFNATGTYLPVIQWDTRHWNFDQDTFSLSSYVGLSTSNGEGINCIAAVVGASLAGIDKSHQWCNDTSSYENWVIMCKNWYNKDNGQKLVLNGPRDGTDDDFGYVIFPSILFCQLVDLYPDVNDTSGEPNMPDIMKTIADRWYDASVIMGGNTVTGALPDYDHTCFDFSVMRPYDNGIWTEPGSSAGIAWIEYMAYTIWGEPNYLTAADWGMQYISEREANPYHETMGAYGAYTAARMNAELGKNYNLSKMINWCFGEAEVEGVIADANWAGYDCDGLVGSFVDDGGYAFAMGTYEMAAAMVPLVRYDDRYARDIGKYMLNAANAARLYYGNGLDATHQDSEDWINSYDANYCMAYEGLRKTRGGISPLATGDVNPDRYLSQTGATNLGLYGSSHVGIFGAIVKTTNVERILQLDCLATDYFNDEAYPTYLYFNPYDSNQIVDINVGPNSMDIYDAVSGTFLQIGVIGDTSFTIDANSAALTVLTPSGGIVSLDGNKKLIDGVVVDYQAEQKYDTCAQIQASPYRLLADLDGDCRVDFSDVAILAKRWLMTGGLTGRADIYDDGQVDMSDFSDFAGQWQMCNDPQGGPDCAANW